MDLYERLDHLDAAHAEKKAGYLLHGLGFTRTMQHTKVSNKYDFLSPFFFLRLKFIK